MYLTNGMQDEKWSKELDPKLQALLSELESGLGSVMRKRENNSSSHGRSSGEKDDSLGGKL